MRLCRNSARDNTQRSTLTERGFSRPTERVEADQGRLLNCDVFGEESQSLKRVVKLCVLFQRMMEVVEAVAQMCTKQCFMERFVDLPVSESMINCWKL